MTGRVRALAIFRSHRPPAPEHMPSRLCHTVVSGTELPLYIDPRERAGVPVNSAGGQWESRRRLRREFLSELVGDRKKLLFHPPFKPVPRPSLHHPKRPHEPLL